MTSAANFEVVDYIPQRTDNSKYRPLNLELMTTLLEVPPGKSVRRGYSSMKDQKAYGQSAKIYIKKQKLDASYFVKCPKNAESDGKFYVYIGRKG